MLLLVGNDKDGTETYRRSNTMFDLVELLEARDRLEAMIKQWAEEFFPPRPAQLVQLRLLNEAIDRYQLERGLR